MALAVIACAWTRPPSSEVVATFVVVTDAFVDDVLVDDPFVVEAPT